MKINIGLLIIVFVINLSSASGQVCLPGTLTDGLVVKKDTTLSYGIYLPSNYQENDVFPVMYLLDPEGRHRFVLDHFKELAEEYGFILVSSPQISNGLVETMLERTLNLLIALEENFNIHAKRRYIAGFSGASRLATTIASISNAFHAVIACGAGQPTEPAHQTKSIHQYSYYGFVGDKDFNYVEMHKGDQMLKGLGISSALHVFSGSHHWPKKAVLRQAFEWIQLRSMKEQLIPINPHYIDSIFHNDLYKTEVLNMKDKLTELEINYSEIINSYRDLRDISNIEEKRNHLLQSEEYLIQNDEDNELRLYEEGVISDIKMVLKLILSFHYINEDDWIYWKKLARIFSQSSEDERINLVHVRLQNFMRMGCKELGVQKLDDLKYNEARQFFKLQKEVDSKDPLVDLLYCKSYVLEGNQKKAIKHLKKAAKLGFNDFQSIIEDPVFTELIEMKSFNELLETKQ